jgi:hypothetical protein
MDAACSGFRQNILITETVNGDALNAMGLNA